LAEHILSYFTGRIETNTTNESERLSYRHNE
jgi:hypothetical protein